MSRALISLSLAALLSGAGGCLFFAVPQKACERDADCEAQVCRNAVCVDVSPTHDAGGKPTDGGFSGDAGRSDAGPMDAGELDGGVVDAGELDAGPADAGAVDAGNVDAGRVDAGPFEPEQGPPPTTWFTLQSAQHSVDTCLVTTDALNSPALDGDCTTGTAANWRADTTDVTGGFALKSQRLGDNHCLAGPADQGGDGTVRMEPCDDSPAQAWRLIPVDAFFRLKTLLGGVEHCLASQAESDLTAMVECSDDENQLWTLNRVIDFECSSDANCPGMFCDFFNGTCAGERREQVCRLGIDDDEDGRSACADSDCVARGECFNAIVVPNASFEEGFDPPSGPRQPLEWRCNDGSQGCGVELSVHPTDNRFSEAADGLYHHFLNQPGFGGPNPSVTISDENQIGATTAGFYRLTVAVGRRNNAIGTTDGDLHFDILSNTEVIGREIVRNPANSLPQDSWTDFNLAAIVLPGSPLIDGDIRLRVSAFAAGGSQATQGQFDAMRLQHSPLGAVSLLNGSFELNATPGVGAVGWETLGGGSPLFGTLSVDPVLAFPEAQEGQQYASIALSGDGGTQINALRTIPASVGPASPGAYALVVSVGSRLDGNTTDGSIVIQLFAGAELFAQTELLDPRSNIIPGEWLDVVAVGLIGEDDPNIGEDLSVQVVVFEGNPNFAQAQIDHVRLFHAADAL